jgi:predicted SprT family Zn-dependent metalloprotease
MPIWVKHALWEHIYPLGFGGANISRRGRWSWPPRGRPTARADGRIPKAVAPAWQAGHVDLEDAETMAWLLIAEHLDTRWSFKWDNAKTRLGACHHRNSTITLSKHFAALNGEAETRDTVLHEIAHALTPGAAHGPRWKKTAVRIGARPTARADGGSLAKPDPTWVAECPRCDVLVWRYRRSRTPVACARCCKRHNGGRFDPRFILTWARPHTFENREDPPSTAAEAPPSGEASRADETSPAGGRLDPTPSVAAGSVAAGEALDPVVADSGEAWDAARAEVPAGEPSPGLAPRPGTRPRTFEATHRDAGRPTQLDLFADLGV